MLRDYTDSDSTVGRVARKVSDFAGGKGLTDYFGGRGTKMGALKSAGTIGLTVGTGGMGLARRTIAKGAGKILANSAAKQRMARHTAATLKETSVNKRLRLYENEARQEASKRVARRQIQRSGSHDIKYAK